MNSSINDLAFFIRVYNGGESGTSLTYFPRHNHAHLSQLGMDIS
jgi:hypothetical protein